MKKASTSGANTGKGGNDMLNALKAKMQKKGSDKSPMAGSSKQFFENMIKEKEKQGGEEGGSELRRSTTTAPKKFSMSGLAKNLNENEDSLEKE